jgi:hypothetical protein
MFSRSKEIVEEFLASCFEGLGFLDIVLLETLLLD